MCFASGCCICSRDARVEEYIAANADKIRELRFKIPTLKFQNGDVQNLKFSVMCKLHNPLVAACKVVAAGTWALMTDLDFMGDKRVIFKSDQVPSIDALCDAVKNGGHGEIVLEASPKDESTSKGEVERAVQSVLGLAKSAVGQAG